ncbi:MAG: BREX-1 system adenine-specific DNA-methyltransferase PglX, partial [Bacteroidetes bacterium]|nr:BREX-1 system adenine-specific DNA-methyltransferase PglX [Bacteroidota bacterium]
MPFLFEKVDDPTELLLPDNLLNTDSVIRQMVAEIPEEDWVHVEIIGWLYQFYISDKKDTLMKAKKAYNTEDIPAVTQLFTPNWIVKYLVQNSLGAKWLATYPSSGIKDKMEYFIEPAEQADEVKKQLKEITPDSLNPEDLTVMDPACGSGHILVEAYNLLKEIYLVRGYRPKDIPSLILAKNLYGLEIDDRAAQLSGFALMMKAKQDDRQIFEKKIKPNIIVLKPATGQVKGRKESGDINQLIDLFESASTFGSLIRVPEELILRLSSIKQELENRKADLNSHDVFAGSQYYEDLLELVKQAEFLSKRYDCVVANPPYMGSKGMNPKLKEFATTQYSSTKSDLFAMFIERGFEFAKDRIGFNAMITMQSWMFLSSFEKCRELWLKIKTITTMAHLGARAFSTISGEVVTVTAFTFLNKHFNEFKPYFFRLIDGNEEEKKQRLKDKKNIFLQTIQDDFKKVPGSPIAYWISNTVREMYSNATLLGQISETRVGMASGNNDKFVRYWHEVQFNNIGFGFSRDKAANSGIKWFPYANGGEARKWYGNNDFVIDWYKDGHVLQTEKHESGRIRAHNFNLDKIFLGGITWSLINTQDFGARIMPAGFLFSSGAPALFVEDKLKLPILGYLNCVVVRSLQIAINPTLNNNSGDTDKLPFPLKKSDIDNVTSIVSALIDRTSSDYNSFETSYGFEELPMLSRELKSASIEESCSKWMQTCSENIRKMQQLEEDNNRMFIEASGLQEELSSEVSEEKITLARA